MVRKKHRCGPATGKVIEDTIPNLINDFLFRICRQIDDELDVPQIDPDKIDAGKRSEFLNELASLDREILNQIETQCLRVTSMAADKGITSLETVANQSLSHEECELTEQQHDEICRSIFIFLHFPSVFSNAESFHFARRYRDHGNIYAAFEVDLDRDSNINADTFDVKLIKPYVRRILDLKSHPTISALDLPAADSYPQSLMMVVRHGGMLSSVFHHEQDGGRKALYYRPQNEAVLIYTEELRRIEICTTDYSIRKDLAEAFAENVLGHDLSAKPLNHRVFDTERFRSSLSLELPDFDDVEIVKAKVTQIDLRLGGWSRRLSLKVSVEDDIAAVAKAYLGKRNVFSSAHEYSRIGIAVRYRRRGDRRAKSLNLTIIDENRSNVQSNRDPFERALGFRLLDFWGISRAFRPLDKAEIATSFDFFVRLLDHPEDQITGAMISAIGGKPDRLARAAYLKRKSRQNVILIDENDVLEEAELDIADAPRTLELTGSHGKPMGERDESDHIVYEIDRQWLITSIAGQLTPLLDVRTIDSFDPDIAAIGTRRIGDREISIYLARGLGDSETWSRLDMLLRARQSAGFGVVLSSGLINGGYLGRNLVMPLSKVAGERDGEFHCDDQALDQYFNRGLAMAHEGDAPRILKNSEESATLYLPGLDPLSLITPIQIRIFERLVEANNSGAPDVKTGRLLEGSASNSLQNAFRTARWNVVNSIYIVKGSRTGYWRLNCPAG